MKGPYTMTLIFNPIPNIIKILKREVKVCAKGNHERSACRCGALGYIIEGDAGAWSRAASESDGRSSTDFAYDDAQHWLEEGVLHPNEFLAIIHWAGDFIHPLDPALDELQRMVLEGAPVVDAEYMKKAANYYNEPEPVATDADPDAARTSQEGGLGRVPQGASRCRFPYL